MQTAHQTLPHPISRRSFLRAVAGTAATGLLTACGQSGASAPVSADGTGQVYYLNFKPEADAVWQELATRYTTLTGVPVRVETAGGGNYRTTLDAAMESDTPPTLFQCSNPADLAHWADHCLDLTDTALHAQMTTDDFNLLDSEKRVRAIGYCYEAFGLIVNKALLAQAGYSPRQITNFASLKTIAEDITARHAAGELPFAAFAPAGLEDTSSWRFSGHLANMPLFYQFRDDRVTAQQPATVHTAYLDNYKLLWDLYTANSDTPAAELAAVSGEDARQAFGLQQAVFYQNGSWEYDTLVHDYSLAPEQLQMIPLYCGVNGEEKAGLCCGTENCWAVNSLSAPEDIQATLNFLLWVVTDADSTRTLAHRLGHLPFKKAQTSPNVFFADANALLAAGCYTVGWAFKQTPNTEGWRADFVQALNAYTTGEAGWDAVEAAFVDGWANHYNEQQADFGRL